MMDSQDDQNVDYLRLQHLSDEFTSLWRRIQALYLDAAAGFALVGARVDREQARSRALVAGTELDSEEFQDSLSFSYRQIFSDEFCTSGIHRATQGEVRARNAHDGDNFTLLGQLCLVVFHDFWNDYMRYESVVAKGYIGRDVGLEARQRAMRDHASHDLWGDISKLRQSVVHNQGRATASVGNCKLIKWFKPGDRIRLTPQHMRALLLALLAFRNDFFAQALPRSRGIKVPRKNLEHDQASE